MALKLLISLLLLLCGGFALKLEKVIVLSRHNVRQPLTENLDQFGSDFWPTSNYTAGHLTPKGALLEKYMGEHIGNWLKENELLKGCPSEGEVFVYANTPQRTKETARAFLDGAFPGCNVGVYALDSNASDPIFYPIIPSNSSVLKDIIVREMKNNLNDIDVRDSYLELDRLVNLTNSYICKERNFCSFYNSSDEIFYQVNEEPDVTGPLKHSNSIVDAYLMAYYEGNALESIAGGQLTLEKLQSLSKITRANQKVRFHSPVLARVVARNLLLFIYDLLLSEIKYAHLVGHDSNLQSVMTALNFTDYVLPEQTENTPIGGKIIFQKWLDEATNDTILKINYVYQTTDQLRNGVQLSKENPPHWAEMEMNVSKATCSKNKNGFSPWTCLEYSLQDIKYIKTIDLHRR